MVESCDKHPHEKGVALCRRCGYSWCGSCLVYSFGPKRPPYCMSCAMLAGGVKTTASKPAMPKKELKARMRAVKAAAKAGGEPESTEPTESGESSESGEGVEADAAMAETDWASPWWEDRQPAALAD